MTCVGFCLNVLKGFLEGDYIQYSDWGSSSHEEAEYLEKYCAKHNLDPNAVKQAHRRISPLELLSSSFFTATPIRKEELDKMNPQVQAILDTMLSNIASH